MKETLRILRYNTGTDKKAFVELKEQFDAVIFNATIVAYSGSSVADLVSMHKRKYIIDPQTHIFQQEISAIMAENKKKKTRYIKKSVERYFKELPHSLSKILTKQQRPLSSQEIRLYIDSLVTSVYKFQTEYVGKYIRNKDYDKYLKFAKLEPEPRMVIAPYFMLKDNYSAATIDEWLDINSECLQKTIQLVAGGNKKYPIAAQLVLDKAVLCSQNLIEKIKRTYSKANYEYVFVWVDEFDAFEAKIDYVRAFAELIGAINSIGKKPIMAYGGYESIMLCNAQSPCRLYGVAQSVGYGEYRPITPVGGGLPLNKYYFLPLHRRLHFNDAADILSKHRYFSNDKNVREHAIDYYSNICDCKQCHEVIRKDINNFDRYNDSTPYNIKTKNGIISRNRPTPDASLISALHFLYCKVNEWESVGKKNFNGLISELQQNYETYCPQRLNQIIEWCKVYELKEN